MEVLRTGVVPKYLGWALAIVLLLSFYQLFSIRALRQEVVILRAELNTIRNAPKVVPPPPVDLNQIQAMVANEVRNKTLQEPARQESTPAFSATGTEVGSGLELIGLVGSTCSNATGAAACVNGYLECKKGHRILYRVVPVSRTESRRLVNRYKCVK